MKTIVRHKESSVFKENERNEYERETTNKRYIDRKWESKTERGGKWEGEREGERIQIYVYSGKNYRMNIRVQ